MTDANDDTTTDDESEQPANQTPATPFAARNPNGTRPHNHFSHPHLPGAFVVDVEQDGQPVAVVLSTSNREARDHRIPLGESDTVAEANPAYPENSPVVNVAFVETLDAAFGDRWRRWTPSQLTFTAGQHDVVPYAYPVGRLVDAFAANGGVDDD